MIDWDNEELKIFMDYIRFSWEHSDSEARGLAEALCAKRLGWY